MGTPEGEVTSRFSSGPPRGNVNLVWASFVLINAGILMIALQFWLPTTMLIGRVAEAGAGILFAIGLWQRVKPHGVL